MLYLISFDSFSVGYYVFLLVNPWRMREGYGSRCVFVCVSVCVSATALAASYVHQLHIENKVPLGFLSLDQK